MLNANTRFDLFGGHWIQANAQPASLLTMPTARRLVRKGAAKWTVRDRLKRGKPPVSMRLLKPLTDVMVQS